MISVSRFSETIEQRDRDRGHGADDPRDRLDDQHVDDHRQEARGEAGVRATPGRERGPGARGATPFVAGDATPRGAASELTASEGSGGRRPGAGARGAPRARATRRPRGSGSRTSPATSSTSPSPCRVIASVTAGLCATSSMSAHSAWLSGSRAASSRSSIRRLSTAGDHRGCGRGLHAVALEHEGDHPLELGPGEEPLRELLGEAGLQQAVGDPLEDGVGTASRAKHWSTQLAAQRARHRVLGERAGEDAVHGVVGARRGEQRRRGR